MARKASARSREDQETRRTQIIAEAIRIVGERGYYGFTIKELAQRCRLSNAGLLYHFGSKDQLLVAMLDEFERRESEVIAPLIALAQQRIASGEASPDELVELLRTMIARGSSQRELARLQLVLQSEALDPSHPAYEPLRAREAALLDLFAKLLTPFVDEPRSTARQLLALIAGLSQQWVRADHAFDLMSEWDRAVEAIMAPAAT